MPVCLDAIPDQASSVRRPRTRRWLLLLAVMMLCGISLTFWLWTATRAGLVFWFTALGLPFCFWGLIFSVRRFAYKVGQVGVESRNLAREALIESEICRGQRCAWILGSFVQMTPGAKPGEILAAITQSVPLADISHPRGGGTPVRYCAMKKFQTDFAAELSDAVSGLSTHVRDIVDRLPQSIPCWLMLDCDSDIQSQVAEQLKSELTARTGRVFRLISGKGLAAFDAWLDKRWDTPCILAAVTISLPAQPQEEDADAITLVVLSNRRAVNFPDALCLHRPEKGVPGTLTKTFNRALLWANLPADVLRGGWFTGVALAQGSDWLKACEENGVTFSLTNENICPDPVLGYAAHVAPWLAVVMSVTAYPQRGPQIIAAQPAADKEDIWVMVISAKEACKELSGNV